MFNYETIVGVEVHVELNTKHKIFSPSLNDIKQPPNTNIHPIDLGLPGTLPRFNPEVLDKAILVASGLGMEVTKDMHWDRKNYFYADNPKGYQITQQETPIGRHGQIVLDSGKIINIDFMHMEEDTAKSFHDQAGVTKLDFNRCGVPLVEIVSAPDMRNGKEAHEYLNKLKEILLYLDASDCKMEEGSLRVDVNVSVRPYGYDGYNPKVEIKNLNSFKNVEIAIDKEVARQIKAYNTGGKVLQATKRFNEQTKDVEIMRIKESNTDYRYFPEPDLPWIHLTDDDINQVKEQMPAMPEEIKAKLAGFGFNEKEVGILMQDKTMCQFFFACIDQNLNPKQMFNYLTVNVNEYLNKAKKGFDQVNINPQQFIELDQYLSQDKISSKHVKEIIPMMLETTNSVSQIISDNNLEQITNVDTITNWVKEVVASNPEALELYKEGKKSAYGFFVGELMKISNGQVSPKLANEILTKHLESLC